MRPLLLVLLAALLCACGSDIHFRSPIVRGTPERRIGPGQLTAAEVQSELMSFTDTFDSAISEEWNAVAAAARADSPQGGLAAPNADTDKASQLRRAALANKLATVSSALSIASSPNPVVGLADMITMITLQRMVLETPGAAD